MVNSHIAEILLLFSRCFFFGESSFAGHPVTNPVAKTRPWDLGFVSTERGAAKLEAARHKAVSAWMTATFLDGVFFMGI